MCICRKFQFQETLSVIANVNPELHWTFAIVYKGYKRNEIKEQMVVDTTLPTPAYLYELQGLTCTLQSSSKYMCVGTKYCKTNDHL